MRSSLRFAVDRHLVDHNVAREANPRPRRYQRQSRSRRSGPATSSAVPPAPSSPSLPRPYLARPPGCAAARSPGSAGATGTATPTGSPIARSRQSIAGRTTEVPTKTAASRRCIDLDPTPNTSSPDGAADSTATATPPEPTTRCSPTPTATRHPESISQLFDRKSRSIGLPTIRFHDLRHTHASCSSPPATPDQGRLRTPRTCPPRLHDGHLPTRDARHGRRRRTRLRRPDRHHHGRRPQHRRQRRGLGRRSTGPTREPPGQRPDVSQPVDDLGRRPRAANDEGPETQCFRAFQLVAGAGFEPATFGL